MPGEDRQERLKDVAPGGQASEAELPSEKPHAYARLRRDITEEETKAPGAQEFLLNEVDRLAVECFELETYREKYHESDKNCAVLVEKGKRRRSVDFPEISCLAIGGAALGYLPSLPDGYRLLGAALGIALVIIGG